jgi:hypothetical protein
MPTLRTPSIAQQRIILVVFSAAIAALAWWQSIGGRADYPEQKLVQKLSPALAPDVVEKLDFTNIEAAWSGLRIDSRGNLQVDALTDTALSDAIALIRDQPSKPASELAMARTGFLLEKQFGATASRQVMELLSVLKHYKEAEQKFWEENGGKNPPPHAELFQLQDEMLGKTLAEKLFSEQRRLATVMLASQQIQNDTTLTQAEKDQALMELQTTLQEKGTPLE